MLRRQPVSLDQMVDTLKAAAESSRLRILLLLSRGDLTVSDLTHILGQSQPRVSRHLKLLLDAGASEDDLKVIDREVKDIVTDATDFAQTSPEPDPSELWTDVLVEA